MSKATATKKENVVDGVILEETSSNSKSVNDSVGERLVDAMSIDPNSFFETIATKKGEVEVTKKVYEFATVIGKRKQITMYDESIIMATEKIKSAMHGRAILSNVICKELANIADTGKLENMGFKNIAEYGKALHGLEVSTVNHYVRIGRTFLNDDYTVKSGLPELSASHFIELNALVGENGELDDIVELYQTGKLVDGMSTKTIRGVIAETKTPLLEKNDDASEEEETPSNNATVTITEEEPTTEELKAEYDSQVVVGQILNACTRIDELFSLLAEHEIKATGYTESLDTIKGLAKTLLQ